MGLGTWIVAGAAGGLVLLAGSMVHVVPPGAQLEPSTVKALPQLPLKAEGVPVQSPEIRLLTVPVQGVPRAHLVDTWGQSRANGARAHQGCDIMAAGGTPVLAAASGTVEKLFYSNGGGGIALYIRSPDRLWSYYYAHLQGYAPGLHEGQQVREGDLIAFVGDTGNAGTGNFHLHFGVSRMLPDEHWWQGQAVNPYPLLVGGGPD